MKSSCSACGKWMDSGALALHFKSSHTIPKPKYGNPMKAKKGSSFTGVDYGALVSAIAPAVKGQSTMGSYSMSGVGYKAVSSSKTVTLAEAFDKIKIVGEAPNYYVHYAVKKATEIETPDSVFNAFYSALAANTYSTEVLSKLLDRFENFPVLKAYKDKLASILILDWEGEPSVHDKDRALWYMRGILDASGGT